MKFLSATRLGENVGLKRGAVNKILISHRLLSEDRKTPTEYAIDNNLCQIRRTKSRFTLKEVNFLTWNYSQLAALFPPQVAEKVVKEEGVVRRQTPWEAYLLICDALCDFGDMLHIRLGEESQLSEEAHDAVVEAYFIDVECLGATRLAHGHFLKNEAEVARSELLLIAMELHLLASPINRKRADRNLEKIEKTMAWLCDYAI